MLWREHSIRAINMGSSISESRPSERPDVIRAVAAVVGGILLLALAAGFWLRYEQFSSTPRSFQEQRAMSTEWEYDITTIPNQIDAATDCKAPCRVVHIGFGKRGFGFQEPRTTDAGFEMHYYMVSNGTITMQQRTLMGGRSFPIQPFDVRADVDWDVVATIVHQEEQADARPAGFAVVRCDTSLCLEVTRETGDEENPNVVLYDARTGAAR